MDLDNYSYSERKEKRESLEVTNPTSNNKRILKNTVYLYLRMIVTTIVSLYTTRITLQLLGAEDFGIFNVVGGVIGFMGIFTGSMGSATQRFLSYDLGKGNINQFSKTFSMLVNIYAIFCLVIVIVLEVIGTYLITEYLNIPNERENAALWIYQFAIFTFVLGTILLPYTSAIVAYEKMAIYAYFTFLDVFFKFMIVVSLYITPFDKLVTYGLLTCIMTLIYNVIYFVYCKRKLDGCEYVMYWNKRLFKKISIYVGWNLFGATSGILTTQGLTVLLNIFFGPVVNAAKAIADKINITVTSFCVNFYMAVNPQIIKSYAAREIGYTRKLVIWSSKFSFYLLLILSVPLISNMEQLLNIWLGTKQVSDEMVAFSQWVLVFSLVNILENPITQAVRATGDIKKYQIVIGVQTLLFIPICYSCFKYGNIPAYGSMIILSIIYLFAQFSRIWIVSPIINLRPVEYLHQVMFPISLTSAVLCFFVVYIQDLLSFVNEYVHLALKLLLDMVTVIIIIIAIGVDKKERGYVKQFIFLKLKHK